jgi:hypothetical protein
MFRLPALIASTLVCATLATPAGADDGRNARTCAAQAKGLYGFQCHGNSFNGVEFDQVTFVGTVEGNAKGFYEGYGTFNSDLGSVDTHIAGQATFGRNCLGRIVYTTNEIVLPGGGTIPLPPATFDFIAVDDSKEILGSGVAPGMTGDFVPRLTCRLVRIR